MAAIVRRASQSVIGLGLLASAFAPLVLVLTLIRLADLGSVAWILVAACCASLLALLVVLRAARGLQIRPVQSQAVRRVDEQVLGFTSSYVLPVAVALLAPATAATVAATIALVGIVALVYVRAGLYHLNVVLSVLGFHVYDVTKDNGASVIVLTRRRHVPQHGTIRCHFIADAVAIESRD